MSDIRYKTALASIKLIQEASLVALEEGDFDFLIQEKVWVSTDRARARRVIEAATYGALDYVGFPRVDAPAEFIAAVIAYYVHPVNMQSACLIMEGCEWSENTVNGQSRPVNKNELFSHVLRCHAGIDRTDQVEKDLKSKIALGVLG